MTATPARRLVEAFGDVAAMSALYAPNISWRLSQSLPDQVRGPHIGADAVVAFNNAVFGTFYEADSYSVEIHDELGDADHSVVRFTFRATTGSGHPYAVEYVLFAKTRDELIVEVVELLDTQASTAQHGGPA